MSMWSSILNRGSGRQDFASCLDPFIHGHYCKFCRQSAGLILLGLFALLIKVRTFGTDTIVLDLIAPYSLRLWGHHAFVRQFWEDESFCAR